MGALAALIFYNSTITISRFEQNQLAESRPYSTELGSAKRFANHGNPHGWSPAASKGNSGTSTARRS